MTNYQEGPDWEGGTEAEFQEVSNPPKRRKVSVPGRGKGEKRVTYGCRNERAMGWILQGKEE